MVILATLGVPACVVLHLGAARAVETLLAAVALGLRGAPEVVPELTPVV